MYARTLITLNFIYLLTLSLCHPISFVTNIVARTIWPDGRPSTTQPEHGTSGHGTASQPCHAVSRRPRHGTIDVLNRVITARRHGWPGVLVLARARRR